MTATSDCSEMNQAPEPKRRNIGASQHDEIEKNKLSQAKQLSQDANLIVQVQSSHLDRLIDYLDRKKELNCNVLGTTIAGCSKSVSLLFLSCHDSLPIGLGRKLQNEPLLARVINKVYTIQPGLLIEGNLSTGQGVDDFYKLLLAKIISSENNVQSLRVQVFPPTEQSSLLRVMNDSTTAAGLQFTISPKGFKHMLSVVEVYRCRGQCRKRQQHEDENNDRLYMVGLSPASYELDVVDNHDSVAMRDDVGRAYWKLKEAIETYEAISGQLPQDFEGAIALDCGAAPGGWTKYLVERFHCQMVYSIDPGLLSPSVMELKATAHMQMKVQDALPVLLNNEAAIGHIKVWVSDMCIHQLEDQINPLLHAKEKGLLSTNAFFVLTMKCKVGHSKGSFDAQVEKAIAKLRTSSSATVHDVQTFHLFSNRSGERTIIGFIR